MSFFRGTTDDFSSSNELEDAKIYDHDVPPPVETPSSEDNSGANDQKLSFWQKRSIAIANRPWTYCGTSLILALILGVGGMILGGFSVTVDGKSVFIDRRVGL